MLTANGINMFFAMIRNAITITIIIKNIPTLTKLLLFIFCEFIPNDIVIIVPIREKKSEIAGFQPNEDGHE